MKYKLIDVFETSQDITVVTAASGYSVYATMTLQPNEVYVADDSDKPLCESLRTADMRIRHNDALERALKECGATYELIKCRSCGGKITTIRFDMVEVIEDEEPTP